MQKEIQFGFWSPANPIMKRLYRNVMSNRLSWLVADFRIFRLFMKGKFDAYVPLWPKDFKLNSRPAYCSRLYFTVWLNCSSNLKNFANSQPSALNFKSLSRSLENFFLTVGQNNFGTGKFLSDALIFASTSPQNDDGLIIEFQVQ